ncbi:succinate dehydrogenase, cytochrome b556 subunit [Suttonella sp. R2A3]|uniref:succinate dehydrogenase, cytochrome b556 subunit n=1 Tax=Suttonella sp. R2A3 TaxID=2908648 RepID=UPI001F301C7C|nr:succinate dehydrogenase, cytochrome b556 subunit [Suttonella sp. R2A3]
MHRATGVASAVGLLLITWWLAMSASGKDGYETASAFFGNFFVMMILFFWSGALIYHFCNGIRHLSWDAGKGLDIPCAKKSARIVQIATVVITLAVWLCILL